MNSFLKSLIKYLLGQKVISQINKARIYWSDRRGHTSYAQEGEDRVLSSLLFKLHGGKNISDGFYVDVGAHDPFRYSNTYLFYRKGWNGINIDAMPGSMVSFEKNRPRDINLESGVGREAKRLKFFIFNEPALNTFDESLAKARCNGVWHIRATAEISVAPLSEILGKFVPGGQRIDFLTIDVEGLDLDVLQSNDWTKFRPLVVLAETFGLSFEDLVTDKLALYLQSLDYIVYSKSVNTTFFVDKGSAKQATKLLFNSPEFDQ